MKIFLKFKNLNFEKSLRFENLKILKKINLKFLKILKFKIFEVFRKGFRVWKFKIYIFWKI